MKTLAAKPRTLSATIIAQDPGVRVNGRILTANVEIPDEDLAPGPWGPRVQVIDYDSSIGKVFKPIPRLVVADSSTALISDRGFHASNTYAIVMRTLARFEKALGRRVNWGFQGHQLKVAPHAFREANAFYTAEQQALLFGYFDGSKGPVYSCLSHDVVCHETTHALVDGIRRRFRDPSSPDQAAFHEGFADVVAMLSVFSLPEVVGAMMELGRPTEGLSADERRRIPASALTPDALRNSGLMKLAKQMGQEMSNVRGQPLRHSVDLEPSPRYYKHEAEFEEPHRRGEILVAAMLRTFLGVWHDRLNGIGLGRLKSLDRDRVIEEGAAAADVLLTMSIRALDYCPPVHIQFGDYLSAFLTADLQIRPDDSKYRYRKRLIESFAAYGIEPTAGLKGANPGAWTESEAEFGKLDYSRIHLTSLTRDPDEVFRFLWQNRDVLKLAKGVYSEVLSVRPCMRIDEDGFALNETVAEFRQSIKLRASELKLWKITRPKGMPDSATVEIAGGGALIFDESGRLKFNIHNAIDNCKRQTKRLEYLWNSGALSDSTSGASPFAKLHRDRACALGPRHPAQEDW